MKHLTRARWGGRIFEIFVCFNERDSGSRKRGNFLLKLQRRGKCFPGKRKVFWMLTSKVKILVSLFFARFSFDAKKDSNYLSVNFLSWMRARKWKSRKSAFHQTRQRIICTVDELREQFSFFFEREGLHSTFEMCLVNAKKISRAVTRYDKEKNLFLQSSFDALCEGQLFTEQKKDVEKLHISFLFWKKGV